MAERMLKFTTVARKTPEKRSADERNGDLPRDLRRLHRCESHRAGLALLAMRRSVLPNSLPLHNNIPDWLRMTAEGRLEEAYQLSQATNSMPEVCGRICPQDRLCEGNCVIEQSGHGTVTIGSVERYLTDKAWEMGWVKPLVAKADRGQSVGVVGAGPAGLAAAELLREQGYAVTVYDRHDRAGGLLIYGIPASSWKRKSSSAAPSAWPTAGSRSSWASRWARTPACRTCATVTTPC
jgi:glutamate synthase (NADPH/NADH) small chain